MEYQISKNEIRIIDKDFRRIASRLLKTKNGNEIKDLTRFLNYIEEQPFLRSFIEKNNIEEFDIKTEISSKGWNDIYDIPIEKEREIAWIYQFLKYCQVKFKDFWSISQGYGNSSRSIQDHINAFCHEVIKPFIDHITDYIGEVMIEMGFDENAKISIQIGSNAGQVNISQGSSTINATNNVTMVQNDIERILELANALSGQIKDSDIVQEDKDCIIDDIEIIKEQLTLDQPKPSRIKKALASIGKLDAVFVKGTTIALAINNFNQQVTELLNKFGVM
jgi:hypothetical protein